MTSLSEAQDTLRKLDIFKEKIASELNLLIAQTGLLQSYSHVRGNTVRIEDTADLLAAINDCIDDHFHTTVKEAEQLIENHDEHGNYIGGRCHKDSSAFLASRGE